MTDSLSRSCSCLLGLAALIACAVRPAVAAPAPPATPAPAAPATPAPAHSAAPAPALAPPAAPPPDDDGPITERDRGAAIDALSAALAEHYVFADKARMLGRALHEHLRRGDYAKLDHGLAFARAVTADMIALVHDKHLEVRYVVRAVDPVTAAPDPDEIAEQRYLNHGVFEVRRMKFNLGYLNFNAFGRGPEAAEKLAAAMRLVADTQGLIIDLRDCRGGDTDTVGIAESYFVPAGTHLLDLYTRAGNTTEHVRAQASLAGPRYAADKPVYVLIAGATVSGCEGFAYALQNQKRATLIGDRTAGAAYFGDPRRLTDHFMAFVPIGRPIDPITHGDWEATGVVPAVSTAPGQALAAAERAGLAWLTAHEASPRRRAAMQRRLAELP